jgi:hypothetical protein
MNGGRLVHLVIPGRAKREPGIQPKNSNFWIPGLRAKARIPE